MIHLDDEYRTIQELKDDDEWPYNSIPTKGVISYIKRLNRPVNVLEFGTGQGHTGIHLIESCENVQHVLTVDPYQEYQNENGIFSHQHLDRCRSVMEQNRANEPKFNWVSSVTPETFDDHRIDILLIDADMTYTGTLDLLNTYGVLVQPDGMIIVSNAKNKDVSNAIKEFRKTNKHSNDIYNVHNGVQFWFTPRKRDTVKHKQTIELESKSQLEQDVWVLQTTQKKDGFFVEFGATDGITGSNTYALEKLGWKGILAEPNPAWHYELANNRPDCIVSHDAVFSETGKTVNFVCPKADDLATIEEYRYTDEHAYKRQNANTIQVQTVSLNDLLERHNAPKDIDYISVDTEGSEYDILKAFDFDKYNVKCFTIEHNFIEPRRSEIYSLMTSKGYICVHPERSKWDSWFIKL